MKGYLPERIEIDDDIFLELISNDDALLLFDIGMKNHQYLMEHTKWMKKIKSIDDERHFIQRCNSEYEAGSSAHYLIKLRSNKIIGSLSFNKIDKIEGGFSKASIGYWLTPSSQSKGYMSKSLNKLIDETLRLTDIRTFIIETDKNNLKSQSIALRNGFILNEKGMCNEQDKNTETNDYLTYKKIA
jgi:ribosomal-protein-serine acetyltransferase